MNFLEIENEPIWLDKKMDWEILRKESIYSNFKTKDLRKKTRKVLLETRK
jgi:hypothetical protein